MATKYDPTSDAATYCRHNGHYCPGCPCECHATPTPGAPLAAPTVACASCGKLGGPGVTLDYTATGWECMPCRLRRIDGPPDPQTPAEREAAQRADEAAWLPMAGGAPSHYTDPAWLADEAWALQAERNAESAREEDADDDLPPTRLGTCPRCGRQYWGDGSRPCGLCEPPQHADEGWAHE